MDLIPNVTGDDDWEKLATGAYCCYDNDVNKVESYGCLYNWHAVDTEKLAPEGWHIPTDAEWEELKTYLTNHGHSGNPSTEAQALKSDTLWNGTDNYGFAGLPAGCRYTDGAYGGIGLYAYFWSATWLNNHDAWYRYLDYNYSYFGRDDYDKEYGHSVRCLRD